MAPRNSQPRRRFLRTLSAGAVFGLAPLAGCNIFDWPKKAAFDFPDPPRENFSKHEIVEHLNDNIHKLRGWRSADVKITVRQDGGFPIKLSSFVAVEAPRNLRIRAKSMLRGDEADFGSNDELFWVWLRESPQKVVFVAPHDQVHLVQARMHLPFDADWLMEALGVVPFDPSQVALERTDPSGALVDLFEERILSNGQRVKLATTVDVNSGLIVGRTLFDPQGQLVARATISKHRVHDHDKPHGGIVMPHDVRIEWPRVKTTMALSLGRIDVNPVESMAETFDLPTIKGCPQCDITKLAARPTPPSRHAPNDLGRTPDEAWSFPERPSARAFPEDDKGFEFEN